MNELTLDGILSNGGDVAYASVITGLDIVWDGRALFHVYRNVGTVNDGRYVFVESFRAVARDSLQASGRAMAYANSRRGRALHCVVKGCGWSDAGHGFSWSQCDGCGSRLGGDRYPLVVWEN